jgi:hypothetical protein
MSSYEQKIKEELKWKIDNYFKDLDFDGGEIRDFADYVFTNNLIKKSNALINEKDFNLISVLHKFHLKLHKGDIMDELAYATTEDLEVISLFESLNDYKSNIDLKVFLLEKINDKIILSYSQINKIKFQKHGLGNYHSASLMEKIIKDIYKKIILPIYERIVNNIDERHFLEQLLERYKTRTEHFTKKQWKLSGTIIDEINLLQPDLALYLFDQGIEYTKESHSVDSNRIDFLGRDYIIEVKQTSSKTINGGTQLMEYLEKQNKNYGYLIIYIHGEIKSWEDKRFKFKGEIYKFGEKTIKPIIIDLRVRNASDETKNEISSACKIKPWVILDIKSDYKIEILK